jgi:hypothetical protein
MAHPADRLPRDDLHHIAGARRDHPAIQPQGLARRPFQYFGRSLHFTARLGQHLALFQGHLHRDIGRPVAHQDGGGVQQLAALKSRRLAPDLKAPLGGGERAVQLRLAGEGHGPDRLARGRIAHRQGASVLGGDPLAVDQQQHVPIRSVQLAVQHGTLHSKQGGKLGAQGGISMPSFEYSIGCPAFTESARALKALARLELGYGPA